MKPLAPDNLNAPDNLDKGRRGVKILPGARAANNPTSYRTKRTKRNRGVRVGGEQYDRIVHLAAAGIQYLVRRGSAAHCGKEAK
jgi:hypothetical protein